MPPIEVVDPINPPLPPVGFAPPVNAFGMPLEEPPPLAPAGEIDAVSGAEAIAPPPGTLPPPPPVHVAPRATAAPGEVSLSTEEILALTRGEA